MRRTGNHAMVSCQRLYFTRSFAQMDAPDFRIQQLSSLAESVLAIPRSLCGCCNQQGSFSSRGEVSKRGERRFSSVKLS